MTTCTANEEKTNNSHLLKEITSFTYKLDQLSSKKDIATTLLDTLNLIIPLKFSSFVEGKANSLKVTCQTGESRAIRNVFTKEMCQQIFNWVMNQQQVAALKVAEKEQFVFIPLIDHSIQHGMLVLNLVSSDFELTKELNTFLNILVKLAVVSMTKFYGQDDSEKYLKLQEQIKLELELTQKLHKSISNSETTKRILFNVFEDGSTVFNGNVWWISELSADITLVLTAHVGTYQNVMVKGSPSAMISGYLLGEMNSLKAKAEISLSPKEVLKHLNNVLNPIFKSTALVVNAWYGVFNISARKVRFANANHPDPFLIGPEQQVSNLVSSSQKGNSLGVSLDSVFAETTSAVGGGSKLIICTEDLLEQASTIGNRYDPTWLPQVLETLGSLSLAEMKRSLEGILSERANGTGSKPSRLALLLEIPS